MQFKEENKMHRCLRLFESLILDILLGVHLVLYIVFTTHGAHMDSVKGL